MNSDPPKQKDVFGFILDLLAFLIKSVVVVFLLKSGDKELAIALMATFVNTGVNMRNKLASGS